MSKQFLGVIAIILIGFIGLITPQLKNNKSQPRLGISHPDQGGDHIPQGKQHKAYNSELPSSGPHYADSSSPAQWGVYTQELPAEVFLHNEEHGGIVIAYRPDLPSARIKELQGMFAPPYADPGFSPVKAILIPRPENKKLIELASWKRTLSLDKFDKNTIKQFYLTNVGNKDAPESFAGPKNTPINQAVQ